MKYGIITYTSAQNWGGILQSYALYKYLTDVGADVELINYRAFDNRLFKPRKQIKDIIFSIVMYSQNKKRISRYEEFRKQYLNLTLNCVNATHELIELNKKYDAFITGSDQLWNCETKICYDFYLSFANDDKVLLAYGPSFGQEEIPNAFEHEVAKLLSRYDMMSVRERSGRRIVQKLTGKEINVVCDPTLLLSQDDWSEIGNPEICVDKYIFIYTTEVSKQIIELVKAYRRYDPMITVISPYAISGVKATIRKDIGPAEFISYIKNANCVIGTSFHAVVFSLIFKRNFYVVPHSSTGARVMDLLSQIGLEEHAVVSPPDEFIDIDYSKIAESLDKYIEESKAYISRMLSYRRA